MARIRFVGSPWVRGGRTRRSLGLAGATGPAARRDHHLGRLHREPIDLGYESPPGITDDVSRRAATGRPAGTQINEKSLRIVAERSPAPRAGRGVSAISRGSAEPADVPDAQGVVPRTTARVGRKATSRPSSSSAATTTTSISTARRRRQPPGTLRRSSTWRPGAGCGPTSRTVGSAARLHPGRRSAAPRIPDAYVACEGPYLVHVADPAINPAEPRRRPGDLRRHLPGRARR